MNYRKRFKKPAPSDYSILSLMAGLPASHIRPRGSRYCIFTITGYPAFKITKATLDRIEARGYIIPIKVYRETYWIMPDAARYWLTKKEWKDIMTMGKELQKKINQFI